MKNYYSTPSDTYSQPIHHYHSTNDPILIRNQPIQIITKEHHIQHPLQQHFYTTPKHTISTDSRIQYLPQKISTDSRIVYQNYQNPLPQKTPEYIQNSPKVIVKNHQLHTQYQQLVHQKFNRPQYYDQTNPSLFIKSLKQENQKLHKIITRQYLPIKAKYQKMLKQQQQRQHLVTILQQKLKQLKQQMIH